MKRFLIRQLTMVLTVAIMMPMTGLAEGTLLNGTAALSTDVDIVAVTETDEEPVEASEIDLPVEEETLVEELNNDNNPDVILPSENVIPAKPGEDLSGETDVPADPDTMPLDDVENASEPISESSDELDNPGNAPDVTDGENQTSTNDDQVIDPQDQGDTTEPVENEGESQSDGISSENIPTENETVVSDQAFTTESNSEDAVPVISTEEQILSEEIQFEETELPKLAAAGPTIPASLTMGLKEKYQLTGGSSYTSSNPKVATVSASGLIIAKKKGNTTINAGVAVCQVTVKAAPKKVKLPKKQTVIAGQSIILTAKVSGGASANITWTSSNPSVATVDSSGMVTGISMGKAKITAKTYNKKKATCTVTVESANAPTMVSFPMGTLFVGKGESVQLKPVLNPGAETKFIFTSKNKKVATVNKSSGLLKGKKVKKSTKITVTTHNKKKATLTVKVLKAPSNVTLSIPSATLDIGGAVAVTASLPSKTASQIYWSSDNPGVANVSDASPFSDGTNSTITVTTVGAGTATITARTFNGKTASCAITVNAPPAPAPATSGGETNNNNKDNTGDTPSVPEIAEPAIDSIINSNLTQGSPLVIVITNVTSNQEYKADVYTFNEDGTRTLIKEYGLDATGNTITIPTEELSMGDYYVRVTTSSADGSTSKSVDVGEITVEESAELLTPSVSINNTTPKQGAVLTIGIKNADQGKGESYKAVISATEYNKEFVSVDGNKTIEIDTTSIPSGNYSLTVVVSANGNSKETDPVELTIKPAALNDISCALSMDGGTLASGSTIPQGKTVIVGIDHTGQDLGENYKVKLSGEEGETVYDVPDGYYAIDTTSLEVGTYRVSATVSATDYDSKTSDALSFTVAALAIPTLTLSSSSVALGEQVVVTVSGNQPVEVEYGASIVNVADESDAAIGMWSGEVLAIDTTGLTAGATYKVSVTVSEKGIAGYAPKTAETTFRIPGLEVPTVTITKAAVKQGGTLEATITNNDDQPTTVIYSAQIKPLEGDRLDVPCIVNETSLSINTNIGTEDEPTFVSVGKYQLIVIASATGYQSVSTEVGEVFIKPQALPEIDYSLWMDGDVLPSGNSIPHGAGPIVVKINNADQTVGESYQAKLYKLDDAQNEIWSKSYDWDETTRSIELDMINDTGALAPDTYKLIITVSAQDYDAVNTALIDITVTSDFLMEGGVIKGYTGNATEIEIPSKDFDGNVNITVGEGAFKESLLTKVVVPEGITTIESQAFAYSSLQEITLPRSLTSIADDVFEGCEQLTVHVPMNCYAYDWCLERGYISIIDPTPVEFFTYEAINGLYAKITGYNGTDSVVVVPEEIDDYTIQEIGANAFANNTLIEKVVLPDSITSIGSQSFRNCSALKEVELGNGVESLGYCSFYACTSLTEFYFPDSVTTLDQAVLANCSELSYVNYPRNWSSANRNGYVFAGCPKLTHIDVPEGVTVIPNYAFANCPNLKTISLPEGLEYVYHHAFSNCTGLTSMVYPSTIKTVGGIDGCTGITEVIIPEGAITIGTNAFDSVPIKTLIIPDSVEEILSYAFQNCDSLETISFGNGIKTIGHYVFYNCTKIDALLLPDSVESIGGYAFANCSNLSKFHFPVNWSSITEFNGTTYYGHNFDNCTKLKKIDIPEGATTIPRSAFQNATFLRDVTFPSTLKYIGADAFKNCTAITTIVFHEGIEIIGSSAFEGCNNLISAMLPDSVTDLYSKAFRNCSKLSSFHYPLNWQTVAPKSDINYNDGFIFEGCVSLTQITIPEGVASIPTSAFNGATYLKKISLPSTLKTIKSCGLRGCIGLTDLSFPDGFYGLGNYSLENCTGISEINLPDSVTVIGGASFRGCTNLRNFHYPKNWIYTTYYKYDYYSIGHIFDNCPKLESIVIPEGVSVVPADAFADCKYLKEVYVPTSVTQVTSGSLVGGGAFDDSPNLTIYCEYGSYILQYAKDRKIPYYYLTPDGVNSPSGTLYKGDSYALYGYARASIPLTGVTATIWDSTGTNVLQTISVNPATTDYSLSGTVNASLLFGNLQLGSYRYTLSARTNVSEEVWVDISFKIVPPPLRIYISGASFPDGLTDVGSGFNITGTVISNYTITKLTISLFTADGVERYTNSVNPGSLTYSLSDLAGNIPIASLPVGDYSIRITAVANGETRILADKSFQPVDLDGEVDEATVQDVVKFVSDNSNASLFPSTYVNSALGRMNASDVLIMAINSRNSWVYGMASTLFTENHENLYLVDLYESELADIIADMNPNTIQLENISSTEKLVADAIMDYGTDILSVFQESSNLNSTTTEFLQEDFTELSSKLKRIKDGVKGTKMSIELANNLSKAMCNYVNGLEILTMVSDSMGTNNSPEFKLAVQRMHAKYKSESFNVVMNMLEVFTKELINMSTKEITTAMVNLGSELGSKVNGGMLYSIVNFAIDASMKLTGYSDIADDYQTFMIQVEAYNTGRNTYENAFYAVKGGDTSARAINRLLVAFTYTKQSSLRIHETISNLRSTPTDEMKNILDYTTKLKNTSIAN